MKKILVESIKFSLGFEKAEVNDLESLNCLHIPQCFAGNNKMHLKNCTWFSLSRTQAFHLCLTQKRKYKLYLSLYSTYKSEENPSHWELCRTRTFFFLSCWYYIFSLKEDLLERLRKGVFSFSVDHYCLHWLDKRCRLCTRIHRLDRMCLCIAVFADFHKNGYKDTIFYGSTSRIEKMVRSQLSLSYLS